MAYQTAGNRNRRARHLQLLPVCSNSLEYPPLDLLSLPPVDVTQVKIHFLIGVPLEHC
uniref:Uncharacterized protein n=1 Tax=Anguilla anguilla TaxID=7936 RepID=A0A0E9X360_ANGAN